MTDFATDWDSQISLVVQEYQALEKLNPGHELLSCATDVDPSGFDRAGNYDERFVGEHGEHPIRSNTRFYFALRGAVTYELGKVLEAERQKLSGNLSEVNSELERRFEERGLMGLFRTHITENRRPLVTE